MRLIPERHNVDVLGELGGCHSCAAYWFDIGFRALQGRRSFR